jgi:tRNA A-37 threonylcarbamoyl transferase component Bud32
MQELPESLAVTDFGPAPAALVAVAEAALSTSSKRILFVEHGGASYVVKCAAHRPRSIGQSLLLRWLVKQIIGYRLPLHTLRLSQASSGVGFEAKRLAALARVGVPVPRVLHQGAGYLLLEHCGTSVATLLHRWTAEVWRRELPRLADQLGAFHRTGQWHGAAQIKNLTRKDGRDYRIDFEEDFGESAPLAVAQAVDLALFLNSISLRARIDEAEARRLLPELLETYFASNPDWQVAQTLVRALPWATALARLAAQLIRLQVWGRRHNGVARLVILVEVLAAHLAPHAAASALSGSPFGSGTDH